MVAEGLWGPAVPQRQLAPSPGHLGQGLTQEPGCLGDWQLCTVWLGRSPKNCAWCGSACVMSSPRGLAQDPSCVEPLVVRTAQDDPPTGQLVTVRKAACPLSLPPLTLTGDSPLGRESHTALWPLLGAEVQRVLANPGGSTEAHAHTSALHTRCSWHCGAGGQASPTGFQAPDDV